MFGPLFFVLIMALVHFEEINSEASWGIWRIEESEEQLLYLLNPSKTDIAHFESIQHPRIRLESIASRMIVKELSLKAGHEYHGIFKNKNAKPFLYNSPLHISYSHTEDFAAAIIHSEKPCGIDLEHIQDKMKKVSSRFLSEKELEYCAQDLEKICIYWCAKEAMYKLYNLKDTEFKGNLKVSDFEKLRSGSLEGIIHVGSFLSKTEVHYRIFGGVVSAFCF
jgi:phosphopantetheinyl transferase (holo-ACP synthase)